jgi:hypothetical protein
MGQTTIEWAATPYFGYYASRDGFILGPMGKILSPIASKGGHLYVFIHRKKKWVHRIILETFAGPCPPGCESRHLDGNPANNYSENLQWATHTENQRDRFKHGTTNIGERSASAKLREVDVRFIRAIKGKLTSRELGRRYGVSHTTILAAQKRDHWRHI